MDRVEDAGNVLVCYDKRSERGDPEPLSISPIVLVGEAHGKAAQLGAKYHVCVDFSEANGRMQSSSHSVPDL